MLRNYKAIKLDEINTFDNNPRTHSKPQIYQIAHSINEFGFTNPVLIDEHNNLIAGHGRLLAAQNLGIDEIPAIVIDGLTDAQRRALIIADNKLALNAGWDFERLESEIDFLNECNFDLDLTGFDKDEIDSIFSAHVESDTPTDKKYVEKYEVLVECKDEDEQQNVYEKLNKEGLKCRVLSM